LHARNLPNAMMAWAWSGSGIKNGDARPGCAAVTEPDSI
jgi:hypothetical protein